MNISQIEQALRNLIASQPMLTSGPSGDMISSIVNIIDAFKNLSFRTQTYPSQDGLKMALQNDCAKLENDICNYVVSVLQERGINILVYLPNQNMPYAGYGYGSNQNQTFMAGQMMFNPNAQMVGQAPNFSNGFYQQNSLVGAAQPAMSNVVTNQTQIKKQEPPKPQPEPVKPEVHEQPTIEEKMENPVITEESTTQPQKPDQEDNNEEPIVEKKTYRSGLKPAGSSNGRDYLLELLKK